VGRAAVQQRLHMHYSCVMYGIQTSVIAVHHLPLVTTKPGRVSKYNLHMKAMQHLTTAV
jgi:hypothetical protein